MAVGGYVFLEDKSNTIKIAKSELVDLVHAEPICKSPPDVPYPHGVSDGQLTYFQGKVLFCSTGCYSLDPGADEWMEFADSDTFNRVSAASSLIGGVWLISGGYNNGLQASSFYWDGSLFRSGPDLPVPMGYHCQVTVSETEVFFSRISFITGVDVGPTYKLDWTSGGWTTLTSLPDTARGKRFGDCGKYITPDGKVEIVSVGDGKSDIYSVESDEWRQGPDYTPYISQVSTVQVGSTFWVVGGKYDSSVQSVSDVLMEYESDVGGFNLLPQKLKVARSRFSALIVPGDFCQIET